MLSSITRACKIRYDRIKTKLPIRKGLLRLVLQGIHQFYMDNGNQAYLALLYTTMFATTYYSLLRISEIVMGTHPILANDMHMGMNKKKFLLILCISKTHNKGMKPQKVKITKL